MHFLQQSYAQESPRRSRGEDEEEGEEDNEKTKLEKEEQPNQTGSHQPNVQTKQKENTIKYFLNGLNPWEQTLGVALSKL